MARTQRADIDTRLIVGLSNLLRRWDGNAATPTGSPPSTATSPSGTLKAAMWGSHHHLMASDTQHQTSTLPGRQNHLQSRRKQPDVRRQHGTAVRTPTAGSSSTRPTRRRPNKGPGSAKRSVQRTWSVVDGRVRCSSDPACPDVFDALARSLKPAVQGTLQVTRCTFCPGMHVREANSIASAYKALWASRRCAGTTACAGTRDPAAHDFNAHPAAET